MRAADVQLQVYIAVELTPDECPDGIANLLADAVRDYLEKRAAVVAAEAFVISARPCAYIAATAEEEDE
jgi:hypothetical protein